MVSALAPPRTGAVLHSPCTASAQMHMPSVLRCAQPQREQKQYVALSLVLANMPTAVLAEAVASPELPNDSIVVGIALVLLVLTAALNLSLGDVVADEANLPSSTSRINELKRKQSTFIRGGRADPP